MTKYYDKITLGFYEDNAVNRIELTDDEWQNLLEGQSQGKIITLENDLVILKNKVFTLDELKATKLADLKIKRDAYKKTIIIKDNITLYDLQIGTHNYENLMKLKFGWTQADKDLYDLKMDYIVLDVYAPTKALIKSATAVIELNNINKTF